MIVGTPSGVTLAPEGGAHQSIGSPLIGMSQDGLAAFEPAFADELAVIMEWAFDYMQRMAKAIRTNAPGCATRPAARSICGSPPTRSSSPALGRTRISAKARLTAPTGCASPAPIARWSSPTRGSWRPKRSGLRAALPRPARCRCAGRHLGRPAQRRLDRGTARPGPGQPLSQEPYRDADRAPCPGTARLSPSSTAILPRLPGSARCTATRRFRSASSISARPARSAISTGISASMPRPSWPQPHRPSCAQCPA
jgi:hypothetical protein